MTSPARRVPPVLQDSGSSTIEPTSSPRPCPPRSGPKKYGDTMPPHEVGLSLKLAEHMKELLMKQILPPQCRPPRDGNLFDEAGTISRSSPKSLVDASSPTCALRGHDGAGARRRDWTHPRRRVAAGAGGGGGGKALWPWRPPRWRPSRGCSGRRAREPAQSPQESAGRGAACSEAQEG